MPAAVCTAKATYKKLSGTLELISSHLQWTQDGKPSPSLRVPNVDADSILCSKEGAAQVRLKLLVKSDPDGYNFTFTSPPSVALAERERFKNELVNIVHRNKTNATNSSQPLPTPAIPGSRPSITDIARAASVGSDLRGTPGPKGEDPTKDFRLRKKVLVGNPELAALHRELVMGGQITEAEFWDGREYMLAAQSAAENQKRGKSGQLVDPRPQSVEGGEIKIIITPQLVHDIFEEYPVVAKAYSDNVPKKLNEAEFWKRYFQSKLFNSHRASIRTSAAQHVDKPDPIFDQYLEKDDDGLEPRRQRDDVIDTFVDLGATQEDHRETGNEKDVTMQAGKQKGVLPLIRKFNEHSERLLNSSLGEERPRKRQRIDPSAGDPYSEFDLDDLHDPEGSAGILLQMQDQERYFEGRAITSAVSQPSGSSVDFSTALSEVQANLQSWAPSLAQLRLERKPTEAALSSMTQNVAARLDVKRKRNELPPHLFSQLRTCQTAANEFLRQFWSAIFPPPTEGQILGGTSTPAQRATRAAKMVGYLAKTHEKVRALVEAAQNEGVDATKVQIAMKPVLDAVDRALSFHKTKSLSKPVART